MQPSEPQERDEELEDIDEELLRERAARSVLPPADVSLGPDELPPIKPA